MSLYQCRDLIKQELRNLEETNSFWSALPFLSRPVPQPTKIFLTALDETFKQRITKDDYKNLNRNVNEITDYLKRKIPASTRKILDVIREDLVIIQQKYQQVQNTETLEIHPAIKQKVPDSVLQTYAKYRKENCIAKINQATLFKLGASKGECLGFTYSMADPNHSPFLKNDLKIDLDETTHRYQRGQFKRIKDQQTIKRSRLTRKYFYPNPTEQAKKILYEAQKHENKDLKLFRKGSGEEHACYLSLRKNGEVWYMDPNHGAFLFAGGKDFIEFYASAAQLEKAAGIDFRFFSLDELRYDENKKSKEVKTWSGMLRTLITGSKYRDNHFFSSRLIMSFYALPAGASGALLGAGLGSVIPVIGTTFGALTGGALGAGLAAVLCKLAFANKHHGLLSVPHLLMDKWQDLKESLAALISPKPAYEAQVNARQEIAADSTKDILSIIKPAQDGIQNQTTTTPVLEEKKNLPLEATSLKDAESNSDLALEPEIHSWIRATPSLKPYSSP